MGVMDSLTKEKAKAAQESLEGSTAAQLPQTIVLALPQTIVLPHTMVSVRIAPDDRARVAPHDRVLRCPRRSCRARCPTRSFP